VRTSTRARVHAAMTTARRERIAHYEVPSGPTRGTTPQRCAREPWRDGREPDAERHGSRIGCSSPVPGADSHVTRIGTRGRGSDADSGLSPRVPRLENRVLQHRPPGADSHVTRIGTRGRGSDADSGLSPRVAAETAWDSVAGDGLAPRGSGPCAGLRGARASTLRACLARA
jgi:hypothetical protein